MEFDKAAWTKVELGDVVTKKEENDRENAHKQFDRFLKVEHMDAESLHTKRWSSQELGDEINPTFYKIFRQGQILFPTRNPHLRRAALASFDGICGEKTLTLESNDELVIADLIPFLFHSESFYEHTTSSIIGSTNPHCRWRDVAKYKFLLPPKEQQVEIAELLWASDDVIQKDVRLLRSAENHLDSEIEHILHGVEIAGKTITEVLLELSAHFPVVALGECGEIVKGKGIPKSDVVQSGLPCVRYGELYTRHHRVIRECKSFISEASAARALRLVKNDVLFAGSGEKITEIGKSAAFISNEETYAGSDIVVFRPHKMDGAYLGYLMNSQLVRHQLNKFGTGATVMHIYKSDLEKIKIPLTDFDRQIEIGKRFERLSTNVGCVNEKITCSKSLHKSLINKVF